MRTRAPLFMAAFAILAACSVRHHARDPLPLASTSSASAPLRLDRNTTPIGLVKPAAIEPPKSVVVPALPATPRVWGRIAISTAIISPSQLIGPEVAYSSAYLPLPVFPEKLSFNMSWGLLSVGEATLGVDKIVMFNGRAAYHLVSQARSNAFCDTFYVVRDLNESWLDAKTLTSLGYSKKIREGHFFRDDWVLYDHDAALFVNRRTSKDGSYSVRTGTIPAQVQDILSSIFYIRAQPLRPGAELTVDVNTPDNWPLSIKVLKREPLTVAAGRFASIAVEPTLIREGIFMQKGKRLRLWFSDDPGKRVLMMKAEVFFGNITATLREML